MRCCWVCDVGYVMLGMCCWVMCCWVCDVGYVMLLGMCCACRHLVVLTESGSPIR